MTPQSELEIKGNFLTHPFAELLAEISQQRLNGSLRIAEKEAKCVVYFKGGQVVFAVSNSRSSRLFDILLRCKRISKEDLVQIPNFSHDFELTKHLAEKGLLTINETDLLFRDQIEAILVDILTWPSGNWEFSPLARIRDGLSFEIAIDSYLVNYSRCLTDDAVLSRFRTLDETFRRAGSAESGRDLTMEEAFVFSRIEEEPISASNIVSLSTLPETTALRSIYTLWLMELLVRENWNPAFSRSLVASIKSTKYELKTEAKELSVSIPETPKPAIPEPAAVTAPKEHEEVMTLNEYLRRVEKAETHYDILGVGVKADSDELKRAYFSLAKNFHPDRFHSEGGDVLKRIQNAFTELAEAHETLKNAESRELYDYRMRKEIAEREKRRESGETGEANIQIEQARENFERGFQLLMENAPADALPFLARAAHFSPQNARYRGYYGRALAFDEKQRHKAEAELQAALRIDPNNATFRLMLAEFFIQVNLMKRAEGELNRLLAIFPSNREARDLLASLKA